MSGIFVNYRSGPHAAAVEAVHLELEQQFGPGRVFLDQPSIEIGDRYPDVLRRQVLAHDVLLVVIHRGWLDDRDDSGTRLIDRDRDWVREEIEIAIGAGKPVVPVLLGDAAPPMPRDLPRSIRELALRQVHRIRRGSFGPDLDRLVGRLEPHVSTDWQPPTGPAERPPRRPSRPLVGLVAALAIALLVTPTILVLTLSDSLDRRAWRDLEVVGQLSMIFLAIPLVAVAVVFPFRPLFLRSDRLHHVWSMVRYRQFAVPVVAFGLLSSTVVAVLAAEERWRTALPIALGVDFVAFVLLTRWLAYEEEREEDDQRTWPQPLVSPVDGTPVDGFRRAVAMLRARSVEWTGRLSREQRDRSWWVMDQMCDAVPALLARTRRGRFRWLIDDHPWWACCYAVWIAATMGPFVAVAADWVRAGRPARVGSYPLLGLRTLAAPATAVMPIVFAAGLAAICLANLDLWCRLRRWHDLLLVDEIRQDLAEFAVRFHLDELARVPWSHLRDVDGPATEIPVLLRGLAGGGADQRPIVDRLDARLLRHGTVGEAAASAVTFLANLAAARHLTTCTRQRLATLLARLATTGPDVADPADPTADPADPTAGTVADPVRRTAVEARLAVAGVTPRLLGRLRTEDSADEPMIVSLAAAVPSAVDARLVAALEDLAAQQDHPCGPAAAMVAADHRRSTAPPVAARRAAVELAAGAMCHATHRGEVTMGG